MKNFAIIGAAGYIAPRHMQAIKETGQNLAIIFDKSDSVGIVDRYFPNAELFLETERFDRRLYHLSKRESVGESIDFVSICSPNYLHDAHIRLALHNHANAICEKPIVLNDWNLDALQDLEKETGKRIYHILQLRLHPAILKLQQKIAQGPADKVYDVDLTYITSRGKWYYYSWKSNEQKSGGVTTNIGVHFFDMLINIFGPVRECQVHYLSTSTAGGFLYLEHARVRWFLSIDASFLPQQVLQMGKTTYRSLQIDDEEMEFSDGFSDLHTRSYEKILEGKGFTLAEARGYVSLCQQIRNTQPIGLVGDYHPFLKKIK